MALSDVPRDLAPQDITFAAQRRQITVMFCDLIGSTALSSQLDPEEMYEVLRAYQSCCTEVIEQAGGFVAKYLGDGVLAYFGYPQAHEDDPERAIHAGLIVAGLVPGLPVPGERQLAARIGIATGLVIVGELIGAGAAEERAVTGETPNLAARLQELAPPGGVVVSAATRRLAAGLFDFKDLGAQSLKGLSRPEPVWEVIGQKATAGRFAARHEREPAPLVGRAAELAKVLERWRLAVGGETEIVGLVGEPGIGKSRLIYELRRTLAEEPHVWLEGGGAQVFRNTPFYVAGQMIRRALADEAPLTPDGYFEALTAALQAAGVEAPYALPLIADLIGAPTRDEQAPVTLAPDQRRSFLMGALSEWLIKTAAQSPALLVVEDLHWVDPSTLELLAEVVPQIQASRLMVVYSTRDPGAAPWPAGARHLQLDIERLDEASLGRLVASTAGEGLPPELAASVVARAGGVPLFAEELARLMLDRPDRADGREIPGTLSDLLMARLDQLGPAKETAQIASVLGAEFDAGLLAAVAGLDARNLAAALERLVEAELIVAHRGPDGEAYAFRHALMLDAAYQALLKSQRRTLHARAAAALAEAFPAIARAQPELVAQHWTQAGEVEPAIAAWHEAARAAGVRRAYREAERAYRQAIELLMQLPDSPEREARELELQGSLVQLLQYVYGFAAPETAAPTARARLLAEKGGDVGQQVMQLAGAWSGASSAGDYESAQRLADQILQLASVEGSPRAMGAAWMMQMTSRYRTGDLIGAEAAFATGEPCFADPQFRRLPGAAPQTFGNAALIAWALGEPHEPARRIGRMLSLSEDEANPYQLVFAHHMAAQQAVLSGEAHEAEAQARRSLEIADQHGFPQFAATARVFLGRAMALLGDPAGGAALILEGLAGLGGSPSRAGRTMYLTWLAETQIAARELDAAAATLEDALTANPNELFFRPESLRLRGLVRRGRGDPRGAEADFRDAVALAKAMGAKLFHERAVAELDRLRPGL